MICPKSGCLHWAKHHKNISILLDDLIVERYFDYILGENSEPFLCKLEDGIVYNDGLRMVMLKGDPLMKRVTEIFYRVVPAIFCNYWISRYKHRFKLLSRKITIVHPLDGYYSFNLHHMQPAFFLLLMGWCICAICFITELLCNRLLCKRK